MQDVVILYKREDHYLPVLGTPELNQPAPAPATGRWRKLFGR